MKNALGFGKLAYVRRTKKTATNIRVLLDAFVGEERGRAHVISAFWGASNGLLYVDLLPHTRQSSGRHC
jgi:hypothetical protein